jgi:methyl-accepting chemotaxis protein
MRRTRLALMISLFWLAAAVAAGICVVLLGVTAIGLGLAGVALATGLGASLWAGRAAEAAFAARLEQLGKAVGLAGEDSRSVEAIVANLCGRLERAHMVKAAFSGLRQPALVLSPQGEILAVTQGLGDLEPRAIEGGTADVLFGEGVMAAGGGLAEDELLVTGGQRFTSRHRAIGGGRSALELVPAGHYISDDDLDAFASALAGGHTSFRFDADAVQRSAALRTLEGAFENFDHGARALAQMLAGDDVDPHYLRSNAGFAPQVRELNDTLKALNDERDEALADRERLEAKMEAVLHAIDRYRQSVTTLAELADQSRAGLSIATDTVNQSRERIRKVKLSQKDALASAVEASKVAQRAVLSVDGVDAATAEIDKLVSSIEDVSFRTNLLALNAAVEAARAGEKGAGFAVVADEVRMLAQATQRTVKDIRGIVSGSRAQSEVSVHEAGTLRNILDSLGRHLENLSNETDMIAGALEEGSGAVTSLDGHVTAVGSEAAKALLLPKRKAT